MNIIEDDVIKKQEKKSKKIIKLVVVAIVIVSIIIAAMLLYMGYLEKTKFKVYIDGKRTDVPKSAFIVDDATGKVYIAPKELASYVGYTAHDGEYKEYGEDTNKCFVENQFEAASIYLNSNRICKIAVDNDNKDDYDTYTIDETVKNKDGKLFISSDGAAIMFNMQFSFKKDTNDVRIFTIPYLVEYYSTKVIEAGYKEISDDYMNQKAILNGLIVVENASEKYGAISTEDFKEKIAVRYDQMKYNELLKEFWVTNAQKKVGIISDSGASKIAISYDELKVLDKNLGLYVAKANSKYGVINKDNQQVVPISFDAIGIPNMSLFASEEEKNQYLLFDNCIPVKQGSKWGMYDRKGNLILNIEYDNFGCTESTKTSREQNNLLTITKGGYEAIVVCRDKKYGLINSIGENLIPVAVTSIYSSPNGGETEYYAIYKEQEIDV